MVERDEEQNRIVTEWATFLKSEFQNVHGITYDSQNINWTTEAAEKVVERLSQTPKYPVPLKSYIPLFLNLLR